MNLKKAEYQALSDFFRWYTAHLHPLNALHKKALKDEGKTELDIVDAAAKVLDELYTRRRKNNDKTAAYIAKKRKTNKNYARPKNKKGDK